MLEPGLIQVAGVIDEQEADMLVGCGVRWLGFPLRLPVHRPDLTESEAARLIRRLPPGVAGVLITYLDRAADIEVFCRAMGARVVQLHGDVAPGQLERLKIAAPDLVVIKSLIVGRESLAVLEDQVRTLSPLVDGFITDTFDPQTGAAGATGRTHDWTISRRLVDVSPRPVILAGGLTPDNVRRAVLVVGPAGVDVHTGVEGEDGRKDRAKVEKFVREARAAFTPHRP
jgi:phosphoribosylanthranilate isomerase